jgi:hypothetical protein
MPALNRRNDSEDRHESSTGSNKHPICYILKNQSGFMPGFLLITTNPIKPDASNRAAAGIGTGAAVVETVMPVLLSFKM